MDFIGVIALKNIANYRIRTCEIGAIFLAIFSAVCFLPAYGQIQDASKAKVEITQAWARATVPGQKATGAFMTITAKEAMTLVAVSSPAAGVAEVHEMKMEGDVMRMRAVAGLALPAGKAVELKPGGYHLMLMDLKAPVAKDSAVPVTLSFKDASGATQQVTISLPVKAAAPVAGHSHSH
jgi:copper(I)-binding protein